MNINAIRFHLARLLNEDKRYGWKAHELHTKMQELFPEITIKQIRTPLNQLKEQDILKRTVEGNEYTFHLNTEALQLDHEEDSDSRVDVRSVMLAILIANLNHFDMADQYMASEELADQILFACQPEQKKLVEKLVDQFTFYHQNLFELSMEGYRRVLALSSRGVHSLFNIRSTKGEIITFQYEGMLIRSGSLLANGYNLSTNPMRYIELRPGDIDSATYIGKPETKALAEEENCLINAHHSIGSPSAEQFEDVVLSLSEEAWERAILLNLPLDTTFNEAERKLEIHHSMSTDFALFVLRLGEGVTIERPMKLREKVREQLSILNSQYE